jgi:uncharacterized protein (UPF0548 family)
MFLLRKPSDAFVHEFLARQGGTALSYDFPGGTRDAPTARPGWQIDRERVLLGSGAATFERAKAAIARWEMFPRDIATVRAPERLAVNGDVAVLYFAALVRLWILFPARIVYLLDESADGVQRFGFGYGTLAGHPERGEERFLVEWDQRDDSVYYDLLAISKPASWLARLGYPYTRHEQGRFRRLSGRAMQRASAG